VKLLVTGGYGFLGSHLCETLLDYGHQVVCLDNEFSGKKGNISHLLAREGFSHIYHDVRNPIDLKVDGIFNLACPASPPNYQASPIYTFMTNILGAENLLNLARENSARILQASTSEVYGDPLVSPQSEHYWGNVNSYGMRSCYDEGKRGAETLFFDHNRMYNTETKVARIFNTYGPRMAVDDGRVVSNFIVQALRGEPLTVFGKGTQTRSLCFVSDLIDGLIKLFFSQEDLGPINLGNPQPITMLELAGEIIELTNSRSEIKFLPLPSDDPTNRTPDIEKAKNALGWSPKIERKEGLKSTIHYFEEQLFSMSEN